MDIVPTPSLSIDARRVKTDLLTSENIFIQTNVHHSSLYGSTTLYSKSKSPTDYNNNSRISPPKYSQHQSRFRPPQDNRSPQLPTRGTRLLNRSRVQNVLGNCPDSPRSLEQIPRSRRSLSLTKTPSPLNKTPVTATDDLTINRSTRNTMIQDVMYFKKQLLRLRRLLQEDEDILKRTDTLNPFEMMNGDISSPQRDLTNGSSRLLSSYQNMNDNSPMAATKSVSAGPDENMNSQQEEMSSGNWNDSHQDEGNNMLTNNNNNHEMMDMRRQLVYLQSQIDEHARTIRIQKNLITKYETEKQQQSPKHTLKKPQVQHLTVATQTERIRPVSQSRANGISSRIEHHIPRTRSSSSGKQPMSLINGLGMDEKDSNKTVPRTNYIDNVLLQNNNINHNHHNNNNNSSNNRTRRHFSPAQHQRGQIYSKKSMDDLLNLKNLSVSPPSNIPSLANSHSGTITTTATATRRVPISRISLKYLRPSLASSTNSLSSLNHSIASSSSSLSDHNNHSNSKSCLKIETNFS